jgi:hypothetical protein
VTGSPPAFHALTFGARSEAAAFVAALSRFLASPAGAAFRPSAEVLALDSDGAVEVFLSEAALDAANSVFAPLAGVLPRATLPPASRVVIDGRTPPLGLEEAESLLGG